MPEAAIEFRDVEYESSGRKIICALNLAINRGEILVSSAAAAPGNHCA